MTVVDVAERRIVTGPVGMGEGIVGFLQGNTAVLGECPERIVKVEENDLIRLP